MSNTGGAVAVSSTSSDLTDATIRYIDEKSDSKDASDPISNEENGDVVSVNNVQSDAFLLSHEEQFPIDPNEIEETQQFTFRAVLVGCILGGVIAASKLVVKHSLLRSLTNSFASLYLGLKTGWTFGASLFGSIFGYAILKPLSKALPTNFGGGYFGPKENVCCQSAATAAGSLGLLFTSGFPAAYQLGLLSATPKEDIGRLITFTACCAYWGMFLAIPLRKFYILKQKLVFPSAVAAAHTIRSLHVGRNAEANARKKTKALIITFICAITLRVVSEYAPGVLWDWHWGWALYRVWNFKRMITVENWNWVWEFTPAFIGVGMLTGLNASWSFFGGSVLAWGVVGPALVATGKAFGVAVSDQYPGYMNYMGMVLEDPINKPTPRYWLIW